MTTTKIYLHNTDGSTFAVVNNIDYERVLDAGVIMYMNAIFIFMYKVHRENAYVFRKTGDICILGDEEVEIIS